MFKQYELMYVFGDEQDLIKLRSNYRNDSVYLYPIKITKEKMKSLFLDIVKRANELKESPEYYNTLTSTCTTNIVSHVNTISPKRIPLSLKVLAPGYSDKLAYDLGLIDTNLTFLKAREHFLINDLANKYGNASDFSTKIRS